MAFIRKIKLSKFILYYFGIRWVAYRFWYSIQLRFGITRRKFPAQKWEEQPLKHFLNPNIPTEPDLYYEYFKSNRKAFFFPSEIDASPQNQFSTWDQQGLTPQEIVDRLAAGEIRYFHNEFRNTGFPPNWFGDSFSQNSKLANEHWTDIAEFDYGDIKLIWEPSRFSSIYALVRAFWRTEDEIYAELFWKLIESWHQNNLPQSGANWKCGQEASIRLMAWIFGLCCVMNCPAS